MLETDISKAFNSWQIRMKDISIILIQKKQIQNLLLVNIKDNIIKQ